MSSNPFNKQIQNRNFLSPLGFPETAKQFADRLNQDGLRDPLNFFSDASLLILTSNYNANIKIKFKDIFPVSLTSLDFTATDSDVNYFTAEASFKYTVYNILDMQGNVL